MLPANPWCAAEPLELSCRPRFSLDQAWAALFLRTRRCANESASNCSDDADRASGLCHDG